MTRQQCSPQHPVAILSFHSHSDRSFLDDRELALLSGVLRDDGIRNDLVLAVIPREIESGSDNDVEQRLVETLSSYDPIIYERVWSPELIVRLRSKLPGKTFIGLRGEHVLLDATTADVFCDAEPARIVGPLIQWLRGEAAAAPHGVLLRAPDEHGGGARWIKPDPAVEAPARSPRYAPNLRPLVINPELLPGTRTFSLMGNSGCPFQLDARENPLYVGTKIPAGQGRGCAFCTTGNHYDGRPNAETAAFVLEQIRHVRQQAPELTLLVLKDQNPFGYLTEVVEHCAVEGLSGFTLLLETRAEWFLRNAARFDRALEVAGQIGVRIAPFLVGIESFSQPELDRFNKGTTVAANIEFLETLWRWKEQYGEAFDLGHAAFGFILFSPWTTMDDLEANLKAIRRTHFDRLRGSILLSRARLYPDTALYYLAERDGLLADDFESAADNASRRYGYYPSCPWKHLHADVAHFASLATELTERNGSRDMVNLFDALLAAFRRAGDSWPALTAAEVWQHYRQMGADRRQGDSPALLAPADTALQQRFARLVRPLSFEHEFAGGWRLGVLRASPGHIQIEIRHEIEAAFVVDIVRRGNTPCFRRSRHYDIRAAARELTPTQHDALAALAHAIVTNDH